MLFFVGFVLHLLALHKASPGVVQYNAFEHFEVMKP
jgi:hypothetical protein